MILDGESNDIVEKFSVNYIQSPLSFNCKDHIYNNILIFKVQIDDNQGSYSKLYFIIIQYSNLIFLINLHLIQQICIFTLVLISGELHLFQCLSHPALQVAQDIAYWMKKHSNVKLIFEHLGKTREPVSTCVHVKDVVDNFNALAFPKKK